MVFRDRRGIMWTYKGIDVFGADLNASGIRWYARTPNGTLRADTKESMRHLINEYLESKRHHAGA